MVSMGHATEPRRMRRGGQRQQEPRKSDPGHWRGQLTRKRRFDSLRGRAYLETALHDGPELLGLGVAGILNLEVATLGDNLLGGKGTLGVLPARVFPPGLDLGDLLGVEIVLDVRVDGRVDHVVGGHGDGYGLAEV